MNVIYQPTRRQRILTDVGRAVAAGALLVGIFVATFVLSSLALQ